MQNPHSIMPCLDNICQNCIVHIIEKKNPNCPLCKRKIEGINKNHSLNNIIQIFLDQNPDKKDTSE